MTFVIPVYNEEKRIGWTFQALKEGIVFLARFKADVSLKQVIFVDDGSEDQTKALIESFKFPVPVKLISYQPNRGKGYALKKGMLAAETDYVLFFDADMSTPLTELEKFLPFIRAGKPVIIGTRKDVKSTVIKHQPWWRETLGKGFTLLSRLILNVPVTDFTCGFKAFSKEVAKEVFSRQKINRWGFDAEILFLANRLGFGITEKAVAWSNEPSSRVKLFKDLPLSFLELLQIRLYQLRGDYQLKKSQTP